VPDTQAAHGPPFEPKCPALHTQSVEILLCTMEVVCPVHCAGDPDFATQKVSTGQLLQALSAMLPKAGLDFPAAHHVHIVRNRTFSLTHMRVCACCLSTTHCRFGVCTHSLEHTNKHTHACTLTHARTPARIPTHTHAHTCTHTHTRTHAYTHADIMIY